jgi:hypothetical protein
MQFTAPGWSFTAVDGSGSGGGGAGGTGCGWLPGGGSYVTLVSPAPPAGAAGGRDATVILETLLGGCNHCGNEVVNGSAQTVTLRFVGGDVAPGTVLRVWQTNATDFMVQLPAVTVGTDGTVTVAMPADATVTLTTLTTGGRGQPANPIPPSAVFQLPYSDDFSAAAYGYDALARYFADQAGSWAVRNGSLQQVVYVDPGANAWIPNGDPITLFGDPQWANYTVSVNASFSPLALRDAWINAMLLPCDASSPYQPLQWNATGAGYLSNTPAAGAQAMCLNVLACQTDAIYYPCVTTGGTCCGPDCYANLQWTLDAAGHLVSLLDGSCATGHSDGSVTVAACGSAPNQTWAYAPSTGLMQVWLGMRGRGGEGGGGMPRASAPHTATA